MKMIWIRFLLDDLNIIECEMNAVSPLLIHRKMQYMSLVQLYYDKIFPY